MDMTELKVTPHDNSLIELTLARALRVGSIIAALLMAAGLMMIILGWAPDQGNRVLTAGLITLVATPVMRVAVALLVFLRERDYLFAFFCLVVLSSLAAGVVIGQG